MLKTINPHAAAIDVGSEKLFVAVVDQAVQVFDTFTQSLQALCRHLLDAGVTTVAMEATGVYWLPVYEVLEAAGLEVCVVNGRTSRACRGASRTCRTANGWPNCIASGCCAAGLCRRRPSDGCGTISGCARITSAWAAPTSSICRRRSIG